MSLLTRVKAMVAGQADAAKKHRVDEEFGNKDEGGVLIVQGPTVEERRKRKLNPGGPRIA